MSGSPRSLVETVRSLLSSLPLAVALVAAPLVTRADVDPFQVQVIQSDGRTVMAEVADLDGDGRHDLVQVVTFGMPPNERRLIRVYPQQADGSIPATPELELPIPPLSAAYDIADVDGRPGQEILLLRSRGIGILSFHRDETGSLTMRASDALIPEDLTIGVSSDERGLDPLTIVSHAFGDEPWLIVPGLGETFFLSPTGELLARVESGARANYFVQTSGLMLSESDIQIFLDAPRMSIGDINGDGRVDILASKRHELRMFYRNPDGTFPRKPSEVIALGRVSLDDHIRGTGTVRTAARDIDGDGLVDLIVSQTRGGVMNASSETTIHFNHGSGWDLSQPDYAFKSDKVLGADQLLDVDGDGKLELVRIGVPISIFELIEIFLTEALDAKLQVYPLERAQQQGKAATPDPWFRVKLDIPLDFETSRPAGFVPTVDYDLNGDGFRDYLTSTDGTRLEVYLGGRTGYARRAVRQDVATEGQIRPADLNADGLTDLLIFNTRRENEPLRLLTNRGGLAGTPPHVSARK